MAQPREDQVNLVVQKVHLGGLAWALEATKALLAHIEAMKVQPGGMEANYAAIEAPIGLMKAHSGSIKAYHRDLSSTCIHIGSS